MTDESIRPSEDPLSVFISSKQDDELSRAKALTIETVESYPGMKEHRPHQTPMDRFRSSGRSRRIARQGRIHRK